MTVDDVEFVLRIEDFQHRRHHVAGDVAAMACRPEGSIDRRHETARHHGVAGGEACDGMAAIGELANELEHDALGPAVPLGRDALDRRRDLGDAKWLDQDRTSERRTTATPPEAEPRPPEPAGSVAGPVGEIDFVLALDRFLALVAGTGTTGRPDGSANDGARRAGDRAA